MTIFNPNFVKNFDKLAKLLDCPASTVGTSTDNWAVSFTFQRKAFYANGRFWVFYSNGTNMVYRTSTDGLTWSDAITIGACIEGAFFSVWFDGTYVHYARYYSNDLFYRRGIPNSDGTIDWGGVAEQTVYDGTLTSYYDTPSIAVDSGGHAWIGARYYNGTNYYPYVFKNANINGTWSTALGFPYQLSTTAGNSYVQPVPLTNLKVYVIYTRSGALSKGQLYDGTSWGSEESDLADYNIQAPELFSAVNEGDNVHFVYIRQTTYQIRYNKRTYGVGWGVNDALVQDAMAFYSAPALSIDAYGNLYCFWVKKDTDHVYYKKCVSGTWDTDPTDWINEATDGIPYDYVLSSFYQTQNNYIGVLYLTKTASPYNVRFDFLIITAPPPPKPKGTIAIHTKLAGII
jgi:hypothetical protein